MQLICEYNLYLIHHILGLYKQINKLLYVFYIDYGTYFPEYILNSKRKYQYLLRYVTLYVTLDFYINGIEY